MNIKSQLIMNTKSKNMNNNVQYFIKEFGTDISDISLVNDKYSILNGIRVLIHEWCKNDHKCDMDKVSTHSVAIFKIMAEMDFTKKNTKAFWESIKTF